MARSKFDRVRDHLKRKGANAPAPAEMRDDVEMLVRRCDEVRGLGQAFGSVELSPFMKSLLQVSGLDTPALARMPAAATVAAAAGV